jgi:hypothetical protein
MQTKAIINFCPSFFIVSQYKQVIVGFNFGVTTRCNVLILTVNQNN